MNGAFVYSRLTVISSIDIFESENVLSKKKINVENNIRIHWFWNLFLFEQLNNNRLTTITITQYRPPI